MIQIFVSYYDELKCLHTLETISNMQHIIRLRAKPQPIQRTPLWYRQRKTQMTASEIANVLYRTKTVCESYTKTYGVKNFKYNPRTCLNSYSSGCEDYIIEKVSSFFEDNLPNLSNEYTEWGCKYEDVAVLLYEQLYNTTVHEFGLITHSEYEWLAASPDGVSSEGIALEIKCPKSRKIVHGSIPIHYWCQVQIQLEVTDLDVCDFIECEIYECDTRDQWENNSTGRAYGILLKDIDTGKYTYPPSGLTTKTNYLSWVDKCIESSMVSDIDYEAFTECMLDDDEVKPTQQISEPALRPIYYIISDYNILRVDRDKKWFRSIFQDVHDAYAKMHAFQLDKQMFYNTVYGKIEDSECSF